MRLRLLFKIIIIIIPDKWTIQLHSDVNKMSVKNVWIEIKNSRGYYWLEELSGARWNTLKFY